MKKTFIVLLIIALGVVLAGCQWNRESAALGEEFSLSLGERENIQGEGLSIVFADILEDSRCPTGAQCVWQGQVRCSVLLTKNGSTYTETFTQMGLTADPATESALGYKFEFRVEPYPEVGKEIAQKDYRLIVKATVL